MHLFNKKQLSLYMYTSFTCNMQNQKQSLFPAAFSLPVLEAENTTWSLIPMLK